MEHDTGRHKIPIENLMGEIVTSLQGHPDYSLPGDLQLHPGLIKNVDVFISGLEGDRVALCYKDKDIWIATGINPEFFYSFEFWLRGHLLESKEDRIKSVSMLSEIISCHVLNYIFSESDNPIASQYQALLTPQFDRKERGSKSFDILIVQSMPGSSDVKPVCGLDITLGKPKAKHGFSLGVSSIGIPVVVVSLKTLRYQLPDYITISIYSYLNWYVRSRIMIGEYDFAVPIDLQNVKGNKRLLSEFKRRVLEAGESQLGYYHRNQQSYKESLAAFIEFFKRI